jgi:hypothetical protein
MRRKCIDLEDEIRGLLKISGVKLPVRLSRGASDVAVRDPGIAGRFRKLVERLNTALEQSDTIERLEAREAFRALVRQVVVTPAEERGRVKVSVETEIAALLKQDGYVSMVGAGTGFEPVTFRL